MSKGVHGLKPVASVIRIKLTTTETSFLVKDSRTITRNHFQTQLHSRQILKEKSSHMTALSLRAQRSSPATLLHFTAFSYNNWNGSQ